MPRQPRIAPGGMVYHVTNRANGRLRLFTKEEDFLAFEKAMEDAHLRHPLPIFAWCIIGNHWHFVVRPERDDQLSKFFGFLALLHSTRWQAAHGTAGMGHVYQSRFKSFMIEEDEHLLWVLRYVERNALRAKLVKRAEDWRWSSLSVRRDGPVAMEKLLSDWPIARPRNWVELVNRPQSDAEEAAIVEAAKRSSPLGNAKWVQRIVTKHGLESTLRPRGRQKGWRKNGAAEDEGS